MPASYRMEEGCCFLEQCLVKIFAKESLEGTPDRRLQFAGVTIIAWVYRLIEGHTFRYEYIVDVLNVCPREREGQLFFGQHFKGFVILGRRHDDSGVRLCAVLRELALDARGVLFRSVHQLPQIVHCMLAHCKPSSPATSMLLAHGSPLLNYTVKTCADGHRIQPSTPYRQFFTAFGWVSQPPKNWCIPSMHQFSDKNQAPRSISNGR